MTHTRIAVQVALGVFVLAVSCSKPRRSNETAIESFVVGVTSAGSGTTAIKAVGAPPSPSNGPSVTVEGNGYAINNGTNLVRLRGATQFQQVFVSVGAVLPDTATLSEGFVSPSGADTNPNLASGFWIVRLPSPVTETDLIVLFAQNIPQDRFDLRFQIGSQSDVVGTVSQVPMTLQSVGTGDVQISVSWNSNADVDLHVVEPGGFEIYWDQTRSTTGGELDLDSNANCAGDNVRNENIRWPSGRAPTGTYIVRVDYFERCGAASTDFVVRAINGSSSQTFAGTFTGEGDQGELGSGREITSLSRGTALLSTGVLGLARDGKGAIAPSPLIRRKVRR